MNDSFKYIIIDDEMPSIDNLKELIKMLYPHAELLKIAKDYDEALSVVSNHSADLLFMDINLGDHTTFEVLDLLNKNEQVQYPIFVTAHEEYALKAFKYAALDYLLKPITKTELQTTIDRIIKSQCAIELSLLEKHFVNKIPKTQTLNSAEKKQRIIVGERNGFQVIHLDNVVYLEADGSYCIIHLLVGESIYVSKNLKYIEALIGENEDFFRVQKSYTINKNFVQSFDNFKSKLIMINNAEVPTSIPYRDLVKIL